jgi:hypothetical protein
MRLNLAVSRILLIACALLIFVPKTANAATTTPKVTSVAPLKLKIGDRLTIRGKGFLRGKNRNTVVFKASGARAVFVKAQSASTTKLVVKVPAKLAAFLKVTAGQPTATRFQLRVLARKLSPSYTPKGASPTIAPAAAGATTGGSGSTTKAPAGKTSAPAAAAAVPAVSAPVPAAETAAPNCDGDALPDATDPDDDNDLLPDTTERTIGTQTCNADSDGDGMEDGWEYQSAKDFNREDCAADEYPTTCPGAKPYPYKRPYTNPLFADANIDYDGDYLPAGLEYRMWKAHTPNTLTDMWYSDGKMSSQDSDPTDGCVGLVEDAVNGHVDKYPGAVKTFPTIIDAAHQTNYTYRWSWLYGHSEYSLDVDQSGPNVGCLSDDERDEDGDFLSNAEEVNLMMTGPDYVQKLFKEPAFKLTSIDGTDPLDPDTDGDGIVDGIDDQDHDDFWNVEEIRRGTESSVEVKHADGPDQDTDPDPSTAGDTGVRTGLWVDPYNPCLPAIYANHCPDGVLLGGTPWRPFYDADAGDAPLRRWPLYNRSLYSGAPTTTPQAEIWDGVPAGQQVLPLRQPGDAQPGLQHPLLPRPS